MMLFLVLLLLQQKFNCIDFSQQQNVPNAAGQIGPTIGTIQVDLDVRITITGHFKVVFGRTQEGVDARSTEIVVTVSGGTLEWMVVINGSHGIQTNGTASLFGG